MFLTGSLRGEQGRGGGEEGRERGNPGDELCGVLG